MAPPGSPALITANVTVDPISARASEEGLYLRFALGEQRFVALSLSGLPPDGPVAVVTLIDRLLLDRVDALLRFRDALTHRLTTPADRVTPQRSRHLAEMLRAIDGRLAGATYQDIGEALYGAERVSAISWKSTPVRDTVMRRVRTGFDLVRGGYRSLLYRHRPR